MIYSRFLFDAENRMIDPYVHILAMPLNLILNSNHLYYPNIQCLLWNMILILYQIYIYISYHAILSYKFYKLTILYIHVHLFFSFL